MPRDWRIELVADSTLSWMRLQERGFGLWVPGSAHDFLTCTVMFKVVLLIPDSKNKSPACVTFNWVFMFRIVWTHCFCLFWYSMMLHYLHKRVTCMHLSGFGFWSYHLTYLFTRVYYCFSANHVLFAFPETIIPKWCRIDLCSRMVIDLQPCYLLTVLDHQNPIDVCLAFCT